MSGFWETVGSIVRPARRIVGKFWSIRQITEKQKGDIRQGVEDNVTGPRACAFWTLTGTVYWSQKLGDPMDPDSGWNDAQSISAVDRMDLSDNDVRGVVGVVEQEVAEIPR